MLKRGFLAVLALAVLSAAGVALGAEPRDDVQAAIKKLIDSGNYSWATTTDSWDVVGATDGMTDGGTTSYRVAQFQASNPAVAQGGLLVVRMENGEWMSPAEVAVAATAARAAEMEARAAAAALEYPPEVAPRYEPVLSNSLQYVRLPTAELMDLADRLKDVKKADTVYTAELSAEVAADLLVGRRPGTGPATAPATVPATAPATTPSTTTGTRPAGGRFRRPEPTEVKGTVTFVLKDGAVVSYAVRVAGLFQYGEGPRAQERSNTTTFTNIGTTKVIVPAEAKAKLERLAAEEKPATLPTRL